MSANGRPVLKLKLGGSVATPSQPPTPVAQTPGGSMKIKIKGPSIASTPAPESAATAPGDTPKNKRPYKKKAKPAQDGAAVQDFAAPAPKAPKNKKRQTEDDAGGARPAKALKIRIGSQASIPAPPDPQSASLPTSALQRKTTIKLNTSTKPAPSQPTPGGKVIIKAKGPPPKRPVGVGYDSEAEDVEPDPAIEHQFILRMVPGEDCDLLRDAIKEKKIGLKKEEGGVDVQMKFFEKEGRRGMVTIRGRSYALCLVDLPTVIEGMKSWDKKNFLKGGDIWQMMLVLGPCKDESEAKEYSPSSEVDRATFRYPHGLTPPMKWVRKRRFRKRTDYRSLEQVEAEVDKLLAADEAAKRVGGTTEYWVTDMEEERRREEQAEQDGYYEDEDGYYEDDGAGEENDEELADEMMQYMLAGEDPPEEADTAAPTPMPDTPAVGETPPTSFSTIQHTQLTQAMDTQASTPAAIEAATPAGGMTDADDDDDDADADDDDEHAIDELDQDALLARQAKQQEEEEIAELQKEIDEVKGKLEATTAFVMKTYLQSKLKTLLDELQAKKGSGGADDDE